MSPFPEVVQYAPEVVQEAPQVVVQDGPEVVHDAPEVVQDAPEAWVQHSDDDPFAGQKQQHRHPKRIFGLPLGAFWLSLLLTVVVVAAAIGGGIGGGMASKSQTSDTPALSAKSPSGPTTQRTTPSPTATTANVTTSSSSAYPSVVRGDTGCPGSNGTEYTSYGSKFQILCGLQWSKNYNDMAYVAAGTLNLCMDQCAMWNAEYAPDSVCMLAVFAIYWTQVGMSNCWLKNVSMSATYPVVVDNTVASGFLIQR